MDSQKRAGLAIILCAILVAMFLYPNTLITPLSKLSFSTGGTNVTGSPQLSVETIDAVLCGAHSPACGDGVSLYEDSAKYQINDAYALATFKKESTYGLAGVARFTHGLGNIRCTSGYSCYEGFRSYATWAQGFADFYVLIRHLYIDTWHLSTVEAIIPKYAPSSENDTQKYIDDVNATISSYSK